MSRADFGYNPTQNQRATSNRKLAWFEGEMLAKVRADFADGESCRAKTMPDLQHA